MLLMIKINLENMTLILKDKGFSVIDVLFHFLKESLVAFFDGRS